MFNKSLLAACWRTLLRSGGQSQQGVGTWFGGAMMCQEQLMPGG